MHVAVPQPGRKKNVPQPHSREKNLAEGADIHNPFAFIKGFQRRHALFAVAELSVTVVLYDEKAFSLPEAEYFPSYFRGKSPSGGVLETRNEVQDIPGCQFFKGGETVFPEQGTGRRDNPSLAAISVMSV